LPLEASARRAAKDKQENDMPRYLVERTFPQGLSIPTNREGSIACGGVIDNNAAEQVTWVHSYIGPDRTKTFCIYDGPSEEAIGKAAQRNGLPVDRITAVRVLDPYFYFSEPAEAKLQAA
jgi:hypothetical protein